MEPFAKAQKEILGEDHSYPMIAYGTAKKSAAWKLYAKSQNIPFEIANEVSNQLKKYELAVKHAEEDEADEIDVMDFIGEEFKDVYARSKEYWGLITSWSIAPCSYLLYQGSIRKEIGLVRIKDHICCLMDGEWAEKCHFLKNDQLKVSVWDLIYRAYEKIGIEAPSVSELLKECTPTNKAWEMYDKGCTLSINQVEQKGTSARVTQYKPKNISELCAFVAAIRPGFKSMYKTFESRKPFSYGVKAFDELIQTEEMPNSFVLYQEMEMAALNYAGIDMSDCYTAIKNIAKKRTEQVLAYKEKFINGFKKTLIENEGKTEDEAENLSADLWQIIEDSSNYSFNASHSYCVSIDSLYCAWLKAHHPLEFYASAISVQEEKGNKDKMNELKEEAENYFNINFPMFKYGQDNREITYDLEKNSIYNSISAIKGFGKSVGEALYKSSSENKTAFSFFDILNTLNQNGIKTSKAEPLIKIGFFSDFGTTPELMEATRIWDLLKQGTAKQLSKEALSNAIMDEIIMLDIKKEFVSNINSKGKELKTYSIVNMGSLLNEIWRTIKEKDFKELPYKLLAENQKDVLGYVDLTTKNPKDRRKLFVLEVFGLPDRYNGGVWKYCVKTKSIGSGKVSMVSVTPGKYKIEPIKEGDILFAEEVAKDKKGYWNLTKYYHIY